MTVTSILNEIRYERMIEDIDFTLPTIFLAGPTVRGNQPHLTSWRIEAIKEFKQQGFVGNVIIPEFSDKGESDQFRYDIPQWEFYGLKHCHCIMFWIPRAKDLIGLTTNHEHGYWMGREREKVIYGRPNDAYRVSYLDIMWAEDLKDRQKKNAGSTIYTKLQQTVGASIELANNRLKNNEKGYNILMKKREVLITGEGGTGTPKLTQRIQNLDQLRKNIINKLCNADDIKSGNIPDNIERGLKTLIDGLSGHMNISDTLWEYEDTKYMTWGYAVVREGRGGRGGNIRYSETVGRLMDKTLKAECTWGDGPDVLLSVKGATFDLTAQESKCLAWELLMASVQADALDLDCKNNDEK